MQFIPGKTNPQDKPVTYVPYYTGPGEISDVVMSARLNTMRLLNRSGWDYKFIIRDANTELKSGAII